MTHTGVELVVISTPNMAKVLPELGDPVEWVPSSISEAARDKNRKKWIINNLIFHKDKEQIWSWTEIFTSQSEIRALFGSFFSRAGNTFHWDTHSGFSYQSHNIVEHNQGQLSTNSYQWTNRSNIGQADTISPAAATPVCADSRPFVPIHRTWLAHN